MTEKQEVFDDSFLRLVHEVMTQFGAGGNVQDAVERIRKLELGLPVEDECISLCANIP